MTRKPKPQLNLQDMEYVIYCRKSTDDSSGQQTQSIPDQIRKCVDYAHSNGLRLKFKPENFEFETDVEVAMEDNDSDATNRQIFGETRKYYIIKEQKSGKIPGLRPKWGKLIKLIKNGQIKGLLSYAPDRQCRNILEGGELINCVDEELIDLKYTNFHFENNAAGKMMLGMRFVFSKQYSDKLSEVIGAGNITTTKRLKSMGKYKYGYYRDTNDGFYKPHLEYFPLIKEAFQMRLYMGASDSYIANWLNAHGFFRETKKKKKPANEKMFHRVWIDPFYYGIHKNGTTTVDLRDNPYYQQIITEEEHTILWNRYNDKSQKAVIRSGEHKYDDIRPISKSILKTDDGSCFTPYIGSIGRFEKKLAKLKVNNPNLELKDIVKNSQIRYKIANKKSKYNNLEITFNMVEKEISTFFKKIKFNDKNAHEKYVLYICKQLDEVNRKAKDISSKLLHLSSRIKNERNEFIKKNMGNPRTNNEELVYKQECIRFDNEVEFIQEELNKVNISERNSIQEFEAVIKVLKDAVLYYKKATNVQKVKICDIFFSNILVTKQKRLTIEVKPDLQGLFSGKIPLIGDDGIRTHV